MMEEKLQLHVSHGPKRLLRGFDGDSEELTVAHRGIVSLGKGITGLLGVTGVMIPS